MPSIKKTVRGIFRQFSFTNPSSSSTNSNQSPNEIRVLPIANRFALPEMPGGDTKNGKGRGSFKNWRPFYYVPVTLDGYGRSMSARENSMEIDASFIHMYLTGRLKKRIHPDIYYGKTGVDLPILQIVPLHEAILARQTGPDGGLTKVPCVNKCPMVKIANLDDELNLSFDADIDTLSNGSEVLEKEKNSNTQFFSNGHLGWQKNGLKMDDSMTNEMTNWSAPNENAHGLSASLYERHPITHLRAGDPVADVFAICARSNSCILALADGVNWGEKSRLAARCAIRGAVDYLNDALYDSENPITNTSDVFRCLLRAFHSGHQLILQEGGSLTTLCVVIVCQLMNDPRWVVCSCNVGDSLAFVFSEKYGVREVTLGSHDIEQMRDMRDAGGALGPVDGVNPELHNFTCAMTLIDENDFVFLTSDGVSDNFDPVVGKFCVIRDDLENHLQTALDKKPSHEPKSTMPKSGLTCLKSPITSRRADSSNVSFSARKTNSLKQELGAYCGEFNSHLPTVEAYQRHELTLLRMEYLLRRHAKLRASRSAKDICENLLNFATELTSAKRSLLEDPELYRCENLQSAQKEYRQRRKFVRQRIATMPGKLDHATVVVYRVGQVKMTNDHGNVSSNDGTIHEATIEPASVHAVTIEHAKAIIDSNIEIDQSSSSVLSTSPGSTTSKESTTLVDDESEIVARDQSSDTVYPDQSDATDQQSTISIDSLDMDMEIEIRELIDQVLMDVITSINSTDTFEANQADPTPNHANIDLSIIDKSIDPEVHIDEISNDQKIDPAPINSTSDELSKIELDAVVWRTAQNSADLATCSNAAEIKESKEKHGRRFKWSKAFDRIERMVKRKHRRGSPSRHTVEIDQSQLIDTQTSTTRNGQTATSAASPSMRRSTFRWSPMKAFRSWTNRSSMNHDQLASGNGDKTILLNSGVCIVPHSVSDTQILRFTQ